MRPRILPDDLDRLEAGLGIVWVQQTQTIKDGNKIDALGALAMEANVDVTSFDDVHDWNVDEFGRDYMRGYCQAWDQTVHVLGNAQNLDSDEYMAGYADGLIGAKHVGLIDNIPEINMEQLYALARPRDPVRDAMPVTPMLLIERKTFQERSPAERQTVNTRRQSRQSRRNKRKEQAIHLAAKAAQ